MAPVLLSARNFTLSSYVAFLCLAFLVGMATEIVLRNRYTPDTCLSPFIAVFIFVGALFGARFFWILQYDRVANAWRAVYFWQGGWVFYGGFIGGLTAAVAYFRLVKVRVSVGLDLLSPPLALGIAITRIGCFLNGCCWGKVTDVPWAVRFPIKVTPVVLRHFEQGLLSPDDASTLPLHPVQLYNSVSNILLFGICLLVFKRKQYDGQVFLTFLCGYGLFRFMTEFYRDDTPVFLLRITLSQTISLILFLSAAAAMFALAERNGSLLSSKGSAPHKR